MGLWNNALLTFFLEAARLFCGLWLYLRATVPKAGSRLASFGMIGIVVLLIALNVYNLFGPPPAGFLEVFGFAMVSYLGLAGIALWLDRLRIPADEPETTTQSHLSPERQWRACERGYGTLQPLCGIGSSNDP